MRNGIQQASPKVSHRPSDAVREKAKAAKDARKQQRVCELGDSLRQLELKVTSGTLQQNEVTHESIYRAAGLTRATYYRYLNSDPELRLRADVLAGTKDAQVVKTNELGSEPAPAMDDARTSELESLNAQLHTEVEERKRLTAVNVNLMQQLALCKTLLGATELDLRAKSKEVLSKDVSLAGQKKIIIELANKLKDLAEVCYRSGLEVDLELSTILGRPSALLKQADGGSSVKLDIIQGSPITD